jgi:hypothetical protein
MKKSIGHKALVVLTAEAAGLNGLQAHLGILL